VGKGKIRAMENKGTKRKVRLIAVCCQRHMRGIGPCNGVLYTYMGKARGRRKRGEAAGRKERQRERSARVQGDPYTSNRDDDMPLLSWQQSSRMRVGKSIEDCFFYFFFFFYILFSENRCWEDGINKATTSGTQAPCAPGCR
jgi:hypothetical protein